MGESMNNHDNIHLTEKESTLIRALRASPELESAIEQLALISGDKDPECYSVDDAEEKIQALGETLKRSSMKSWAQKASDSEARKVLGESNTKRSKKKS